MAHRRASLPRTLGLAFDSQVYLHAGFADLGEQLFEVGQAGRWFPLRWGGAGFGAAQLQAAPGGSGLGFAASALVAGARGGAQGGQ